MQLVERLSIEAHDRSERGEPPPTAVSAQAHGHRLTGLRTPPLARITIHLALRDPVTADQQRGRTHAPRTPGGTQWMVDARTTG